MFTAMVYACLTLSSESCLIFKDKWGPSKTIEECLRRTNEMAAVVASLGYKPLAYKCERSGVNTHIDESVTIRTRQNKKPSAI